MNKVLNFVKTSSIYFIGSILTKLISFVLLPLYSNKLSTDAFGYYDYTITIITIVVGAVCLEVWTGAIRFMLLKNTNGEKNCVVCNSIILISISMIFLFVIFLGLKYFFSIPYLNYIALYAVAYMFQSLYTAFIRGYQKNVSYIISGLLSSLINFSVNIYFVGICGKGLEFLYIAFFAGAVVQIFYIELKIHTLRCLKKENVDVRLIKNLFIFCVPLFINSISYWVLTSYSKVVIINEMGAEANGIYSMGLRFSSAITLITSVLSLAWQEMVFSEKNDTKQLYTNGLTMYYHLLIYALVIALPLLKVFYPALINEEYMAAMVILPICLLNTLFNAFADFTGKVVIAENQTKWIFMSSVIGAVSCAFSANMLVKIGLIGVTCSILIGFSLSILLRLGWLKWRYHGAVDIKDKTLPFLQLLISLTLYYMVDSVYYVIITLFIIIWIVLRHKGLIVNILKKIRK